MCRRKTLGLHVRLIKMDSEITEVFCVQGHLYMCRNHPHAHVLQEYARVAAVKYNKKRMQSSKSQQTQQSCDLQLIPVYVCIQCSQVLCLIYS